MPLLEVLAEYRTDLLANGRTAKHAAMACRDVQWASQAIGANCPADFTTQNIEAYLAQRVAGGWAANTRNGALRRLGGFFHYLVRHKVLITNPTAEIRRLNPELDRRHERRSLTLDECQRLLAVADGRRLFYAVALSTGLRVGELAALRWADVELGSRPRLCLTASGTKAKRAESQPIGPALAEELQNCRPAGYAYRPQAPVFPSVPSLRAFHRDLDRAGIEWTADERGRVLDRHSLRVTYGTVLAKAGVSLVKLAKLMRHTDPKLTFNTYMDVERTGLIDAVALLPDFADNREGSDRVRPAKAKAPKLFEPAAVFSLKCGAELADAQPVVVDGVPIVSNRISNPTVGGSSPSRRVLIEGSPFGPIFYVEQALDLSRLRGKLAADAQPARPRRGTGTAGTVGATNA